MHTYRTRDTVTLDAGTVLLNLAPEQIRRRAAKLKSLGEGRHEALEILQFKKGELITLASEPDKRLALLLEPAGVAGRVAETVGKAKEAMGRATAAAKKLL